MPRISKGVSGEVVPYAHSLSRKVSRMNTRASIRSFGSHTDPRVGTVPLKLATLSDKKSNTEPDIGGSNKLRRSLRTSQQQDDDRSSSLQNKRSYQFSCYSITRSASFSSSSSDLLALSPRKRAKISDGQSDRSDVVAPDKSFLRNTIISASLTDIPKHLHDSELYSSLMEGVDSDNESGLEPESSRENTIDFPAEFFKRDLQMVNSADLKHLLSTMKFWGCRGLPDELIEFCMVRPSPPGVIPVLNEFAPFLDPLNDVIAVRRKTLRESRLVAAAELGNLSILQHLQEKYRKLALLEKETPDWSTAICTAAARNGYVDCLRIARNRKYGYPWGEETYTAAWGDGNYQTECIHFLLEQHCPLPTGCCIPRMCRTFALRGDARALLIAHANGLHWDSDTCNAAAWKGHLDCLQIACEKETLQHMNWTPRLAAAAGNLECLEYLVEQKYDLSDQVLLYAAGGGHVDCIKLVQQLGYPLKPMQMVWAATYGHLLCVKYLHQQRCPWDKRATQYAAGAGQLACLRYLHEAGCSWDADTTNCAFGHGSFECLEYAISQGCEVEERVQAAFMRERDAREEAVKQGLPLPTKPLTYNTTRRMLLLKDRLPKWCESIVSRI